MTDPNRSQAPSPPSSREGGELREALERELERFYTEDIQYRLDGWTGATLERGYASSWHYGELWTRIRPAIHAASFAVLARTAPASDGRDEIRERLNGISAWLGENAPYVVADQKHLNENTAERAYWHYGYKAALSDVLALTQGDAGNGDKRSPAVEMSDEKPVAYAVFTESGNIRLWSKTHVEIEVWAKDKGKVVTPLYMRPAPSPRFPAGTEFDPEKLSDSELQQCMEEQRSRDETAMRAYAPAGSDIEIFMRSNAALTSECLELRAQVERAPSWRPIETAPKDGTRILVTIEGRPQNTYVVRWRENEWQASPLGEWVIHPTHWCRIPTPALAFPSTERGRG